MSVSNGNGEWQGVAALRPGRLMYVGRLADAHRHRHAAVQVVLAAHPIGLRDGSGTLVRSRAAVIPPGAEHEMAADTTGLLVFVDAHGDHGRALTALVADTGIPVSSCGAWSAAASALGGCDELDDPVAAADAVLRSMVGTDSGEQRPGHPTLLRAIEHLPGLLGGPVRLTDLATTVGISSSRLGHLFSAELGLPFRAYVRWARLRRAISHAMLGGTLTDAAHAAGFADSAHLTRVCHEMFGLAPSHLARAVRWA